MDLPTQLANLLRTSCDILDVDACSAIQIEDKHHVGHIISCQAHSHPPCNQGKTLHLNNSLALKTYQSNELLICQGSQIQDFRNSHVCRESDSNFYLGVPMIINNQRYGVLNFYAQQPPVKPFTTLDLEFVNLINAWVRSILERIIAQEHMEQAARSARAANDAKSYFLANMSHEIRTPLTTIIGYSENLTSLAYLKDDARKHLNTIIRAGRHLHELINDILDLSKIEAGQLLLEIVQTSPIATLQQAIQVIQPLAEAKKLKINLDISYPIPEFIYTDPTRLRQIVLNLCSNAVKFTEQGEITIRMRYLEPMAKLQFTVVDTGIGMTDEEMERILHPFTQADSSITRRYGGTGLGLYISQQLVEKLGGHMSFFSKRYQGSEFDFTIDVGDVSNVKLIHNEQPNNSATEHEFYLPYQQVDATALIVDDTTENRDLLKYYLNQIGLQVEEALNGMEALTILKYKSYDLVLMDTNMPELDGISTIKALRENGYKNAILSVSANALQQDFQRSQLVGANGYITKPIEPKKFYETIYRLLEKNDDSDPATQTAAQTDARFESLVSRFLDHLPEKLKALSDAVERQDWALATDISHNLKGLGGGYGFQAITEHAKVLNDELKNGRCEFAPQLCKQLVDVCNQILTNKSN